MRKIFDIWILTATALVLTFTGCAKEEETVSKEAPKETSAVIANVGNAQITETEFKEYLKKRPLSRRGGNAQADIQSRLDALVMDEVLYQEALRQKLDKDPDVKRRIQQMLVQRLISRQVGRAAGRQQITDEELKAYYDQHSEQYNRPAQARVADIFIAVPADADKKARAEKKKQAESILAEVLKQENQRVGFSTMMRKHSDTNPRYRRGDTGFFDEQGQPLGLPQNFVDAAFALERVGDIPEKVIETPEGFHVIMLLGKRRAVERPFETVKRQIANRLRREKSQTARQDYMEKLKAEADIQINEEVVEKLAEEMAKAPPPQRPAARTRRKAPQSGGSAGPPMPPQVPEGRK